LCIIKHLHGIGHTHWQSLPQLVLWPLQLDNSLQEPLA